MDTRASGWWAMIFTVFTEASLFTYLLFCILSIWRCSRMCPALSPKAGRPSWAWRRSIPLILLTSSVAVG